MRAHSAATPLPGSSPGAPASSPPVSFAPNVQRAAPAADGMDLEEAQHWAPHLSAYETVSFQKGVTSAQSNANQLMEALYQGKDSKSLRSSLYAQLQAAAKYCPHHTAAEQGVKWALDHVLPLVNPQNTDPAALPGQMGSVFVALELAQHCAKTGSTPTRDHLTLIRDQLSKAPKDQVWALRQHDAALAPIRTDKGRRRDRLSSARYASTLAARLSYVAGELRILNLSTQANELQESALFYQSVAQQLARGDLEDVNREQIRARMRPAQTILELLPCAEPSP